METPSAPNRILILTESAVSDVMNQIIDETVWNKILRLPYQPSLNIYKSKKNIDRWIALNGLNAISSRKEIFINDDKRWRNQLLLTGIAPDRINLIEDGLGAYIRSPYPLKDRIYRGIILKSVFGNRMINSGPISTVTAERFFAFRKNAYPWFGAERKLHLLEYKNSLYINKINKKSFTQKHQKKLGGTQLIILTSPLIEDGVLSPGEEFSAWEEVTSLFTQISKIGIKPHPREKQALLEERINCLKKGFKNSEVIIIDNRLPAEILLCNDDFKADVFSPNSTSLANLKSIRPDLKIYHGIDIFFSQKKIKDPRNSSAFILKQLGVGSIKESENK